MKFTQVFPRIVKAVKDGNHTVICYGGSSSSKTISILQYITIYAHKYPNKRITISSESMPVIKKTLFPDWIKHVMQDQFDPSAFNKSEMIYNVPNGTTISFIPADDESRFHGMRQDIAYFDELFYVKRSIWDQAEIRTPLMFGSFNPVGPFWVQEFFDTNNVFVDHSTYHDNPYLDESIIQSLERRAKGDENFYRVYVKGEFGLLEGMIFEEGKHFIIRSSADWPAMYKRTLYGLDFGYSVHPTGIVEVGLSGGELWLRERCYKLELTNDMIAGLLRPDITVVADSAEPKSIQELRNKKLDIIPSKKGRDSINSGIDLMKTIPINIDSGSVNLIKEFRNYRWATNASGEPTGKPHDSWNHLIDATRYAVSHLLAGRKEFTLSPV